MPAHKKPTVLKLISGTAQPCRTNKSEPEAKRGIPPAPKHLSSRGLQAWPHISALLNDMGVLAISDPIGLEGLCEAYADLTAARDSLNKPLTVRMLSEAGEMEDIEVAAGGERYYWTHGKSGPMRRARPELSDIADADRRLMTWVARFGLTPADRARVSTGAAPAADANPFASI